MRLLVLGGTHFLGRHVVDAALAAGHDVATLTRGRVRGAARRCPRLPRRPGRPAALPRRWTAGRPSWWSTPRARPGRPPSTPPPRWTRRGYAFVSSLNAYRGWPPGPVAPGRTSPTWTPTTTSTGPIKAHAERVLGGALGDRFLTARAGLVVGPLDPIHRLGWWLDRIAAGGRGRRPRRPRPADRAGRRPRPGRLAGRRWRSRAVRRGERHRTGRDDDAAAGCSTPAARSPAATRSGSPVPEADAAGRRGEPWQHLPLWLPADVAPHGVGRRHQPRPGARPAQPAGAGLGGRHLGVAADPPATAGPRHGRTQPGLPAELEARLLAGDPEHGQSGSPGSARVACVPRTR